MAFRVRPMSSADIPGVVNLQVSFLNGSIVTQLGPRFLTSFHTNALGIDGCRSFVAHGDGGRLLGFAVGSVDVHEFNARMKPKSLLPTAIALLSPSRMHLAVSLVRMISEGEPQPPMPAELLLLVVDPSTRRQGVGRALLQELETAFAAHRIERYRVAVRSQLAAARAFYEALAFVHEQDRSVLGQPMTYLTKQIRTAE